MFPGVQKQEALQGLLAASGTRVKKAEEEAKKLRRGKEVLTTRPKPHECLKDRAGAGRGREGGKWSRFETSEEA
jgi:hypothetical protein